MASWHVPCSTRPCPVPMLPSPQFDSSRDRGDPFTFTLGEGGCAGLCMALRMK